MRSRLRDLLHFKIICKIMVINFTIVSMKKKLNKKKNEISGIKNGVL